MKAESIIEEMRKLTPEEREVVKEFVLSGGLERESRPRSERRSLHELLSQSPFAELEFNPQGVRSTVRRVEL